AAVRVEEAELGGRVEQLERGRRGRVDHDAEGDRPGAGLNVDGVIENTVVVGVGDADLPVVAEIDAGEVDAQIGQSKDFRYVRRSARGVVDDAAVGERASVGHQGLHRIVVLRGDIQ